MGLEQSEQMFRAAATVERESRPLLLFYALGQAGRAFAAASNNLSGTEWKASGHGLKFSLERVHIDPFWDLRVTVNSNHRDLFSRASVALNSSFHLGSEPIGGLVADVPEFVREFPEFVSYRRLVNLDPVFLQGSSEIDEHRLIHLPVHVDPQENTNDFLATVPILADFQPGMDIDGRPKLDQNGKCLFEVPATEFEQVDGAARLKRRQNYRGQDVALRALGDSGEPVHPLMVWWMILYAISMLARYDPHGWLSVLDVRRSSVWSQIEHLEDRALDAVPHLLAESLATLNM